MQNQEFCYWCGAPATSREHVPPKCLFPEGKDFKDLIQKDFRKNLITVPSCDAHNLRKSNDDEYLMICLASRTGNNVEAFFQAYTKVRRARERNPSIIDVESEAIIETANAQFPVQWVNVDTLRLSHSFEAIARALYFYEFGVQFEGRCQVVTRLFSHPDAVQSTQFNIRACEMIELEIPSWNTGTKGENPEIFTYQFSPEDPMKVRTLCLTFYGKTRVYVILSRMTDEELIFQREKHKAIIDIAFGDILQTK